MQVGDIVQLERENRVGPLGAGLRVNHYSEAICVDQLDADIYRTKAFNLGVFDVNEVSRTVLRIERPAGGMGNPNVTDWRLAPRGEYYRACNYHLMKLERSSAKALRERSDERVSLWVCRCPGCSVGVWGEPRTGASHSLPANQGTRDARREVFELVKQLTARSRNGKEILSDMMEDMKTPSIGWMNGTECQMLARRIMLELNPNERVSILQAIATGRPRVEANPFWADANTIANAWGRPTDRGSTFSGAAIQAAYNAMAIGAPASALGAKPVKQEPQIKIVVERTREIELD